MRLVCPNCAAQYEVPESVIPENGRDVQCSSCGHTWFQGHPSQIGTNPEQAPEGQDVWADDPEDSLDEEDDESIFDDPSPQEETARQDAELDRIQKPSVPQDTDADEDEPEDEWEGFPTDPGMTEATPSDTRLMPDPEDPVTRLRDFDEDDYEEDPALDLPRARRGLDTSVADLLREEAEREARARASERAHGLESQPDLGLDAAPGAPKSSPSMQDLDAQRRTEQARQRMARLRGDEAGGAVVPPAAVPPPPPPVPPAAAQPVAPSRRTSPEDDRIAAAAAAAVAESRRGLLPDIEEINSSLRSTSDRRPARADDHDTPGLTVEDRDNAAGPKRSFSRSFSVTLLIAMVFLALYVFAPALVEMVPAIAPVMDAYVSAVDALRVMLDRQVQNLSQWLAEIAGSTS